VKALHPVFEATVVGVDVLDVKRTINDVNALLNIDRSMRDARGFGKRFVNSSAIRAENGIFLDQWLQHGSDVGRVDLLYSEISGLTAAIAHNKHSNLLPLGPDTATFAGRSMQLALSFEGLQKEGLVGFDNAAFPPASQ
jgi:hypothetical protein